MAGASLKVERIVGAYSQLRISGVTTNPIPGELDLALDRMENMAAEWNSSNICSGYNFEDEPDPNSDLGVPREHWQAFDTNLAIRLIPDFNKQVPPILMALASGSLSNLSARSAMNRVQQVPYPSRHPRGSGNTHRYYRWNAFYQQTARAPNSCKTNDMIYGDVDDFVEHFDAYLDSGEEIASYSLVAESGINIQTDSNTTTDVNYRVLAEKPNESSSGITRQLTIIVITTTGRVETRYVYFNLSSS
jgi:hypothetical protein